MLCFGHQRPTSPDGLLSQGQPQIITRGHQPCNLAWTQFLWQGRQQSKVLRATVITAPLHRAYIQNYIYLKWRIARRTNYRQWKIWSIYLIFSRALGIPVRAWNWSSNPCSIRLPGTPVLESEIDRFLSCRKVPLFFEVMASPGWRVGVRHMAMALFRLLILLVSPRCLPIFPMVNPG